MKKVLVAYFSASGVTARAAKEIAEAVGADLYEIRPVQPYTDGDLNWMDKKSRSTVEMNDPSCRPPIAEPVENLEQYDLRHPAAAVSARRKRACRTTAPRRTGSGASW